VVIGWLIHLYECDYTSAHDYVKLRRDCIDPNKRFKRDLDAYATVLLGNK